MYAIQLDMDHKLIQLLVRHAAWRITHFQIKTPYERLRNGAFHVEAVEFAETAHRKDPAKETGKMDDKWHVEIWLGMATDEQYIGTSAGVQVALAAPRRGAVVLQDTGWVW